MEHLRTLGQAVGMYSGDGQGEMEDPETSGDTEPGVDDQSLEITIEDSSDNANHLLFFFDYETTGFSIYDDHLTEVAAKVFGVPHTSLTMPTFESLVHTPRNIPKRGTDVYTIL